MTRLPRRIMASPDRYEPETRHLFDRKKKTKRRNSQRIAASKPNQTKRILASAGSAPISFRVFVAFCSCLFGTLESYKGVITRSAVPQVLYPLNIVPKYYTAKLTGQCILCTPVVLFMASCRISVLHSDLHPQAQAYYGNCYVPSTLKFPDSCCWEAIKRFQIQGKLTLPKGRKEKSDESVRYVGWHTEALPNKMWSMILPFHTKLPNLHHWS